MADNEDTKPASRTGSIVLLVVMTAFMVSHYLQVQATGSESGLLLVRPVFLISLGLAVIIAVEEVRGILKERAQVPAGDEPARTPSRRCRDVLETVGWSRAAFVAAMVAFWLGLLWFGFIITSLIVMPAMFLALRARRPVQIVAITIATTALLYVGFDLLLGVRLDG